MSQQNASAIAIEESWASAFIDGEASLSEQNGWSHSVHEQLYYYTVTRQVLREEASTQHGYYELQRAIWTKFWARIDTI